jgi:CRP-like cAMP-binding protein
MSTETIRRMRRVPFLNSLSADALRMLSFSGEILILRLHEVLFEAGSVSKGGYFLLQGMLAMEQNGQVVHRIETDSLIGELALVTKTIHPMTAVARTGCTLLHLPRTLFTRVLHEFPEDALALKKVLTEETLQFGAELRRLESHFTR